MDFDQIRALLTEHFKSLLIKAKAEIAKSGRLNQVDKGSYGNSAEFAQQAVSEGWSLTPGRNDAQWLDRLIKKYDLPVQPGTDAYETLRTEAIRAYRDYCSSVLAYDRSLETYDLASAVAAEKPTELPQFPPPSGITLSELASRFTAEGSAVDQARPRRESPLA